MPTLSLPAHCVTNAWNQDQLLKRGDFGATDEKLSTKARDVEFRHDRAAVGKTGCGLAGDQAAGSVPVLLHRLHHDHIVCAGDPGQAQPHRGPAPW